MTAQAMLSQLTEQFDESIVLESSHEELHPWVRVHPEKIQEFLSFVKNHADFSFDFLRSLAGVDYQQYIEINYILFSYAHGHELIVKTQVNIEQPFISSVEKIWPAANWYEREVFDLLGVSFKGHSDMRRILLPDDWEGHPLRKNYREKKEYRGVSTQREYLTGMPELPTLSPEDAS
ncbi:MAG: NADH-quinone oxidoreductase subunit C [Bdellovibrionales bacterium]|nr:NADH-quinone oxidoreductase subunit C [Bdellovibrionales bacterium]